MKPKTPASPPLASGIPVYCAHLRIADITSLIPNPRNPNRHGDTQVALLAKIIRHQGWRAPITISRRSGFVVTGHGRLEAAKLLQVAEVPVDEQDFATEADEWAHLIADNRIAELADADRTMLRDLAEELDTGDFDMDLTGFDVDALEELMTAAPPEEKDDSPKQSDDDYSLFELVMLHANKLRLIDALNVIKQSAQLETNEEALMRLIENQK